MVSHSLIFPIDFFVRVIESMVPSHFKNGQMPTEGGAGVIYVYKPYARLTYHERVSWRGNYPVRNVRLKVDDASVSEVEVVPPPSHHRIRLNSSVLPRLKEG